MGRGGGGRGGERERELFLKDLSTLILIGQHSKHAHIFRVSPFFQTFIFYFLISVNCTTEEREREKQTDRQTEH